MHMYVYIIYIYIHVCVCACVEYLTFKQMPGVCERDAVDDALFQPPRVAGCVQISSRP